MSTLLLLIPDIRWNLVLQIYSSGTCSFRYRINNTQTLSMRADGPLLKRKKFRAARLKKKTDVFLFWLNSGFITTTMNPFPNLTNNNIPNQLIFPKRCLTWQIGILFDFSWAKLLYLSQEKLSQQKWSNLSKSKYFNILQIF